MKRAFFYETRRFRYKMRFLSKNIEAFSQGVLFFLFVFLFFSKEPRKKNKRLSLGLILGLIFFLSPLTKSKFDGVQNTILYIKNDEKNVKNDEKNVKNA
jgi:hypothetical protein